LLEGFHVNFVLGVELPEGRLQLILEVRSLRVFFADVVVEAKGLLFQNCFDGRTLSSPRFSGHFGIGQNLLKKGVSLGNGRLLFGFSVEGWVKIDNKLVFIFLSKK
jgi:hypothetical protein